MGQQNLRIASIDILRALTMLLMVFVNDLWSLTDIPGWLEHTAAEEDGMGLADVVFPAFLFLVGMSIPLSVQQREMKGEGKGKILLHILERSIALLIMGLFLVNGEYLNEAATGIQRGIWNLVCCTCFILLWNSWPRSLNRLLVRSIRLAALLILVYLAWRYRGGEGEQLQHFATHWWGILGLIGWAYLASAVVYVLAGGHFIVCLFAWLLFVSLCIANHAGLLPDNRWLQMIISPLGEGAMPAFTMGGALITLIVLHFRKKEETGKTLVILAVIAILLFVVGVYLRGFWGISKIRATPAWVFICSAITIAVFIPLYWLADKQHKASWFNIIKPGGTNTLLCYLLPYFAYTIMGLLNLHLPPSLLTGGIGLLQSFIFALLIVVVAGVLGKWGLKLKL
jgi:heparan-alpha-glucosaminide N-acetyltransferase